MSFLGWMTATGALLLLMALSSGLRQHLPISTAAIYLIVGALLGPFGFALLRIDIVESVEWFERLAEIAVIVSLFVGGLHLRLPLRDPAWRSAYLMAGPVMILSIIGVALVSHFLLGIPGPVALLIGAVLAPTDPVLASMISVNDAHDHDRMRYGISGEAGLNDGMAFPFVVFALLWAEHDALGSWIGEWAIIRVLWAVPAGLLLGLVMGRGVGRLAVHLRSRSRDASAPNDFLALAVIALSYVAATAVGAWGFLAVFAAGIGMRAEERNVVARRHDIDPQLAVAGAGETVGMEPPPAEHLVPTHVAKQDLGEPAVAAGVMVSEVGVFGDTVERLLEVLLVVIVGVVVADSWSIEGVLIGAALFLIIRPLATWLCLAGAPTTTIQRVLMGWFGIRGIGSLYYLSYAIRHRPGSETEAVLPIVLTVIAMSVFLHGVTAQPVLQRYRQTLEGRDGGRIPS